jgi:hypothetical protein
MLATRGDRPSRAPASRRRPRGSQLHERARQDRALRRGAGRRLGDASAGPAPVTRRAADIASVAAQRVRDMGVPWIGRTAPAIRRATGTIARCRSRSQSDIGPTTHGGPRLVRVRSAAGEHRVVTRGSQFLHHDRTVVPLELDHAVADRAPDPAAPFEPARERAHALVIQRNSGTRRNRLAPAAGQLPPDLHPPTGARPGLGHARATTPVTVGARPHEIGVRRSSAGHFPILARARRECSQLRPDG